MAERSIFADEWRDCLRAQYRSVVRADDQVTLKTLVGVMYEVGFSEAELRELYLQATMRAEDVADDFMPDMDILARSAPEPAQAAPVEPTPAPEPEPEPEAEGETPDDSEPQLPPGVQQLSLF